MAEGFSHRGDPHHIRRSDAGGEQDVEADRAGGGVDGMASAVVGADWPPPAAAAPPAGRSRKQSVGGGKETAGGGMVRLKDVGGASTNGVVAGPGASFYK